LLSSEKKDFVKKREKNRATPCGVCLFVFYELGKLYSNSRKNVKKKGENEREKREKMCRKWGGGDFGRLYSN
jgi:hypothetical protein